jgi:TRAP-type C4-dicarboxylate transport system substrate-binding protein
LPATSRLSIHTRAARRLGDLLESALGDDVAFEQTVSILDQGRPAGDLAPLVAAGTYDMCYMSTIGFVKDFPILRLFDAPFVIADRDRVWRELDGAFGDAIRSRFAAITPFRVLGFWDNGFRQISNRVRPIRSPDDCRGLSIRTQINDDIVAAFRLIGFEPRPVDIKVAVEELTAGRIDAQENPLTSINAFGIQKLHRHVTLTGHVFGVALLVCNAARYASWPQPFRDALHDAADAATAHQRALAAEQDSTLRGAFEDDGVTFVDLTEAERTAFAGAVAPLIERMTTAFDPALLARLRG